MIDTPGAVIDPYDDNFESLKGFFNRGSAPDFIKTASVMDQADLQRLPDHSFAMVYVGKERPLRKYACIDPAHVAVNVMYFLQSRDEFPDGAKEKVAANLLSACRHFELVAPPALIKEAQGKKVLIKTEGRPVMTRKKRMLKESDLSGSPVMPLSARPNLAKLASARVISDPYITPEPGATFRKSSQGSLIKTADITKLSYANVQRAIEDFKDYGEGVHPRERHRMCIPLVKAANELGVPVDEVIGKYGSQDFETSVFLRAAAETRKQYWAALNDDGTAPNMLDMLLEKQASGQIEPEVFAESLAELDIMTGIDRYWDSEIPDPWFTTFGVTKQADEQWRWSQGTEYLTKDQLENFSKSQSGQDTLKKKFGESMSKGLRESPVAVFDSLPLDTKRAIARMAQQHESGA